MRGAALGARILYEELSPNIDPFSPENKIIFLTGPLTATLMPLAKGHIVVSKSPLTGTICKSSSGGLFGAELKRTGYDYVLLEGKSKDPVYIEIVNRNVEIRDADRLWGETTHETEDILKDRDRDLRVSSIGPAGENLVRFACIINEKHNAAGRGGLGAVLGSKKVKALAVRGTNDIEVHDVEGLARFRNELMKKMRGSKLGEDFSKYGTSLTVPMANEFGIYPTRNFQSGKFAPFEEHFDPVEIYDEMVLRAKGCFGCPVSCNKVVEIEGQEGEICTDRQEYETFFALGGNRGVSEIRDVILSGHRCNQLGLDTISAGVTISFAMELAQRGILKRKIMAFLWIGVILRPSSLYWKK